MAGNDILNVHMFWKQGMIDRQPLFYLEKVFLGMKNCFHLPGILLLFCVYRTVVLKRSDLCYQWIFGMPRDIFGCHNQKGSVGYILIPGMQRPGMLGNLDYGLQRFFSPHLPIMPQLAFLNAIIIWSVRWKNLSELHKHNKQGTVFKRRVFTYKHSPSV